MVFQTHGPVPVGVCNLVKAHRARFVDVRVSGRRVEDVVRALANRGIADGDRDVDVGSNAEQGQIRHL
jgi:hypothetical protein